MSKHIKKFENEAAYNEFKASENYVKPNLSWCKEENTFKAEYRPFNAITVTAEEDSITATAEQTVASTITIVLSGDINNVITIISGQTTGTLNIDASESVRTCNLSVSPDSDKAYSYVLEASAVTIPAKHNYAQDYLTIVSTADNNVIYWKRNSSISKTISISTDNGQTWVDKTCTTAGNELSTLNTGDKILVKGNNSAYCDGGNWAYFASTDGFNVEGNIMSLIFGNDFIGKTTISSNFALEHLFIESKIIDASDLILPATTLHYNCYYGLFYNCTNLTSAPELPATSLQSACYRNMFRGCTSLTKAPTLPAVTLAEYCYHSMFMGCSSLNYIKCLARSISADMCTHAWVQGVAKTGTFIKNSSMNSWATGANGIPSGWTVQNA